MYHTTTLYQNRKTSFKTFDNKFPTNKQQNLVACKDRYTKWLKSIKKEPQKRLNCKCFYSLLLTFLIFSDHLLPLQNLLEVVCLRVLDAESLDCFVILRSYVVRDVVVVVLSCTSVDVNYAWRNLAGCRILAADVVSDFYRTAPY